MLKFELKKKILNHHLERNSHLNFILLLLILVSSLVSQIQNCYQTTKLIQQNHFVLVVDKSGSMGGEPIAQAKNAIKHFIDKINPADEASIIAFSDQISVTQSWTSSKSTLKNTANNIYAGGGTHLYDALAKAFQLLNNKHGQKIIVFLSDGSDGGSRFGLNDIINMNASEGVFIYSIGLGGFDSNTLSAIANKTNGSFDSTSSSNNLTNIYSEIITEYYTKYSNQIANHGAMQINSFPSNRPVVVNGKLKGHTPLTLNVLSKGKYDVVVEFIKGDWECSVSVNKGELAKIDAREYDLGNSLIVSSVPHGSSVFLDDTYMGFTSFFMKNKRKSELVIKEIPRGKHTLKLITFPEDEEFSELFEFDFKMTDTRRVVDVNILKHSATFENGEVIQKLYNPFDDLE